MLGIRRREFIRFVGGAAAAWPVVARAQQAMPVIGFLHTRSREAFVPNLAGFLKALRETGFDEGRNVSIEYRFADGRYDQLPALAADLVRRQVAVLVAAGGEPAPLAAKAATSSIPIVFSVGTDPVKAGLVASYNRPGGNITGLNILTDLLEPKRLGLLHELVPQAETIGYLWNPSFSSAPENQWRDVQAAAGALRLKVRALPASTVGEIDAALDAVRRERVAALAVGADPFLDSNRDRIIAFVAHESVPAIYQFREHVMAGGLMSYGIDLVDVFRQVGLYVGRILKGEKPADLPVLQPIKFEFVINLRIANVLGIKISDNLLSIADEVIE